MQRVFVGLGSNRGDRRRFLTEAVDALSRMPGWTFQRVSSLYETEPVGNPDQPPFLNGVVEFANDAEPEEILKTLKEAERRVGRTPSEKWGPREIDLDLLYVGSRVSHGFGVALPHPEVTARRFVLVPLAEIAPDFIDPLRKSSVGELLRDCADQHAVEKSTLTIHPLQHEN